MSSSRSKQSTIPSASVSIGKIKGSKGSVLHWISRSSVKPSLSSSGSALFPIPSESVSIHSVESKEKESFSSVKPSLSSSSSHSFPVPSLSESNWSGLNVERQLSIQLTTPSPSESFWHWEHPLESTDSPIVVFGQISKLSGIPSPSESARTLTKIDFWQEIPSFVIAKVYVVVIEGWTWRLLSVDPSDHKKVDEVAVEDKTVFWPSIIEFDPADISGKPAHPKGVWQ